MTPDPIPRRKLADAVFDRLEQMITSGEMRPGDEMPSERVLMERFGVGRPAIREAMQALAGKGLVAISHGERARVLQVTAQSIFRQVDLTAKIMLSQSDDGLENLKSARIFFERGMAREAAAKTTAQDLDDLAAIIAHQRAMIGRPEDFIAADMAFHARIARISGNPIFSAVSEAMLAWLRAYHMHLLIWAGNESVTLDEHEGILACLAARDADRAEAAMRDHLERARALYSKEKS
ncbi:GntR family transcriptional regulator [Xaviernesmea oryzae]|uniref:GntR family transcriptional regulator n=2 Tax=Xaviernesmea oryzae TaxID=464029 RepID=A0A1Q9B223_9HYPH|nr:GntR family transcriptional regulator [Xaviernesmea oryzae]